MSCPPLEGSALFLLVGVPLIDTDDTGLGASNATAISLNCIKRCWRMPSRRKIGEKRGINHKHSAVHAQLNWREHTNRAYGAPGYHRPNLIALAKRGAVLRIAITAY